MKFWQLVVWALPLKDIRVSLIPEIKQGNDEEINWLRTSVSRSIAKWLTKGRLGEGGGHLIFTWWVIFQLF